MEVIAFRGAPRHAPENSRVSLMSAYAAGADRIFVDVRMSADGHLVLAADPNMKRLTGDPAVVERSTLAELSALDLAKRFAPKGSAGFRYYDPSVPSRRVGIETLPGLIDELPEDARLLIAARAAPGAADVYVVRLLEALLSVLRGRRARERVLMCLATVGEARLLRALDRNMPVVTEDAAGIGLIASGEVDGVMLPLDELVGDDGVPTRAGLDVAAGHARRGGAIGAVAVPRAGALDPAIRGALESLPWLRATTTDSLLEPGLREGVVHLDTRFEGKRVDTARLSLGYAKANPYGRIHQEDGVHVVIWPYDGPLPKDVQDPLGKRLARIEAGLHFANRDWPYYSGGGVGTVVGIRGDFSAETEYRVETVAQATTLEMAVTNVDPGAHQAKPPTSFREKDSFYDPHGAPPYVGVEHDEDDGYRINWNLGTEYDNNQYGKPVGDGRTPRGARLRLERRGPVFAAYYRDPVDAAGAELAPRDWVCVGVVRNESLNPTVFLRCVGKRWLQESEDDPDTFVPVVSNQFTFMMLRIIRHP